MKIIESIVGAIIGLVTALLVVVGFLINFTWTAIVFVITGIMGLVGMAAYVPRGIWRKLEGKSFFE